MNPGLIQALWRLVAENRPAQEQTEGDHDNTSESFHYPQNPTVNGMSQLLQSFSTLVIFVENCVTCYVQHLYTLTKFILKVVLRSRETEDQRR